jgi:hypothetical protein
MTSFKFQISDFRFQISNWRDAGQLYIGRRAGCDLRPKAHASALRWGHGGGKMHDGLKKPGAIGRKTVRVATGLGYTNSRTKQEFEI